MDLKHVIYGVVDGVARVTINRPDKMNALNREVLEDLNAVFAVAGDDKDVKAILLTGEGDKAFVAGADIAEIQSLDGASGKAFAQYGQEVFNRIESSSKPVVAAINGFALGGGCELAMACHLRVAAENARFGQPEVNLGLIPGYGGTQRLPRLIGRGPALHLLLSGDMIEANRALELGLVSKVVPKGEAVQAADALIATIMAKGPLAIKYCLDVVNSGLDMPLEAALDLEANLFGLCAASADMKEGTGAFLGKRKPAFKGE